MFLPMEKKKSLLSLLFEQISYLSESNSVKVKENFESKTERKADSVPKSSYERKVKNHWIL